MNNEKRYATYALCREMLETAAVIRRFDADRARGIPVTANRVMLSGEGSSRLFPAKRLIAQALRMGWQEQFVTEGATQAAEYRLAGFHLFVASNSGKTAEGVRLLRSHRGSGSTGIVAFPGTPIATEADSSFVLDCGAEDAVAATKSVIEQAMVYDELFRARNGAPPVDRQELATAFEDVLTTEIPREIIDAAANASVLYFAGRNDGVAEELTLKTNEITRKRSDYLEGTYAVHGIEEIMQPDDLVIVVDPFPAEEEKFRTVLRDGVGMNVVAIAARETSFPTIRIPDLGELNPYLHLAAGWNMLVEIGLAGGINLDKPARARKVGNEFTA
jgi:glucosamine--fructose-6-phosphate aminotransferase (isomerizing)